MYGIWNRKSIVVYLICWKAVISWYLPSKCISSISFVRIESIFLQYTGDADAKTDGPEFWNSNSVIFENFLKFSKRRHAVPLQPIWTIMVAAKRDHSRVLVSKFHQNRSTLKGRSAGQRHTGRQTDRQTRLKIRALQVCNQANNRKKPAKQQYVLHMPAQYGELRPTSGWDRFGSLGHPYEFQRVSRLGSVILHGTPPVVVIQTLRCWTEGTTYIRQGDHYAGHWPTHILHCNCICVLCIIMAALWNRGGPLYFCPVVTIFLSFPLA